jgi:hypothetical protein
MNGAMPHADPAAIEGLLLALKRRPVTDAGVAPVIRLASLLARWERLLRGERP